MLTLVWGKDPKGGSAGSGKFSVHSSTDFHPEVLGIDLLPERQRLCFQAHEIMGNWKDINKTFSLPPS